MAFSRYQNRSFEDADHLAILVASGGPDGNDAGRRTRGAGTRFDDFRLAVQRIPRIHGRCHPYIAPSQVGDCSLTDVSHAQPNDNGEREWTAHDATSEFAPFAVFLVAVQRVLVECQQGEPDIVGLGQCAARPMLVDGADFKLFEESSGIHDFFTRRLNILFVRGAAIVQYERGERYARAGS